VSGGGEFSGHSLLLLLLLLLDFTYRWPCSQQ